MVLVRGAVRVRHQTEFEQGRQKAGRRVLSQPPEARSGQLRPAVPEWALLQRHEVAAAFKCVMACQGAKQVDIAQCAFLRLHSI